jgi:hypothetical protein
MHTTTTTTPPGLPGDKRPGWAQRHPPTRRESGNARAQLKKVGTMKKAIFAALVVAATSLFGITSAAASTHTVAYGTGAGGTLNSGYAHPKVRPSSWWWGADGGLSVRGLSWRSWGTYSAYGRGTRWLNTCIPYCYNGSYKKAPASITLWRVRLHNGQRYFTRLTLRWTNRSGHHKHLYVWGRYPGGTVPFWH